MIIRKTTAIVAAIFLVTIANKAEAKLTSSLVNEFCGDRYCGYRTVETTRKRATHRHHRQADKPARKEIQPKAVKVASLEEIPTSEHPKGLLQEAKKYLGGNPTGWRSLWCARFIAYIAPAVAERLKRMGLNPNWARDYAKLDRSKDPKPGDIVVLTRGSGGHIGILDHFDKHGNPVIISGNHGHKVGIGTYSKGRVIAYASI